MIDGDSADADKVWQAFQLLDLSLPSYLMERLERRFI